MAASLVSVGTRATATTGTTITPALPASLVAGDLMVAVVSIKSNATISTPAGWTKLQQTNSGASFTTAVYWRLWQAGDAAVAYTWTGSVNNEGQILRITGANTTTPIGTVGAVATGTTSPHTSTGFSSTRAVSMALLIDAAAAATALTNPTGWTALAGGASNVAELTYASKMLGPSGSASGSTSSTGAAAAWTQQQIEIYPQVALSINGTPTLGAKDISGWLASPGVIPALTTTTNNNLIVVVIGIVGIDTPPHGVVSSVTASGLTFTRRSAVYFDSAAGSSGTVWESLEIWSAQQSAAGSTGTVSVAFTGPGTYDVADGIMFAVCYDGVSYPVWSNAGSDPVSTTSSATTAPTISTVATSADAFVFGFAQSSSGASALTVGSGMTLILNHLDGNAATADNLLVEYKPTNGVNSGLTVASALAVQAWQIIGDAIEIPTIPKYAQLRQYLRR